MQSKEGCSAPSAETPRRCWKRLGESDLCLSGARDFY